MTLFRRYRLRRRLRRAYAARDSAQAAHNAAVARGDTRAQHRTLRALRAAVAACLSLEVG